MFTTLLCFSLAADIGSPVPMAKPTPAALCGCGCGDGAACVCATCPAPPAVKFGPEPEYRWEDYPGVGLGWVHKSVKTPAKASDCYTDPKTGRTVCPLNKKK